MSSLCRALPAETARDVTARSCSTLKQIDHNICFGLWVMLRRERSLPWFLNLALGLLLNCVLMWWSGAVCTCYDVGYFGKGIMNISCDGRSLIPHLGPFSHTRRWWVLAAQTEVSVRSLHGFVDKHRILQVICLYYQCHKSSIQRCLQILYFIESQWEAFKNIYQRTGDGPNRLWTYRISYSQNIIFFTFVPYN